MVVEPRNLTLAAAAIASLLSFGCMFSRDDPGAGVAQPAGIAADEGITVRLESVDVSETKTLVTVVIDSPRPVTQLGPPHVRVDGQRVDGSIVGTSENRSVVELAFPSTPQGRPVTLVMGPFAHVPADTLSATVIDLRESMARQALTGELGESGVIDPADIITAGSAEPDVLSYEFRRAARVGEKATVIAFTVTGTHTDLEAMFALTDAGPLPLDSMVASHKRDASGMLTEGTTLVAFRLPPGVPDTVVLGTDGRMEIIRGDWSIELTP